MIASYVGENAEFERQYLSGELEVELTPQVSWTFIDIWMHARTLEICPKEIIYNFASTYDSSYSSKIVIYKTS